MFHFHYQKIILKNQYLHCSKITNNSRLANQLLTTDIRDVSQFFSLKKLFCQD